MEYVNTEKVFIMWQPDKSERSKGTHVVKFNAQKPIQLQVGDEICIYKDDGEKETSRYWVIEEIVNSRQSTLKDFSYVTCNCKFQSK